MSLPALDICFVMLNRDLLVIFHGNSLRGY